MLYPSREEIKDILKNYKTVPVFYELLVDSYTPVQLFNALHEAYDNCFILESVENSDQWGRYSFVGINPKAEITLKNKVAVVTKNGTDETLEVSDPIGFLSDIMKEYKSPRFPNRPKLTGGLIGYFAYDMVRYFEKTLCNPPEDDLGMPDANLFLFDEIVAYDHLSNKAVIILNIHSSGDIDKQYENCIKRKDDIIGVLKSYVSSGNVSVKSSENNIEIKSNITKEKYMEKNDMSHKRNI